MKPSAAVSSSSVVATCIVWFPNPLAAGSQMGALSTTCRDAQLHLCLYWSEKRQLRAKQTKISPIWLFRKSWEFVPTGWTLKGDRKPELEFNNATCNITELHFDLIEGSKKEIFDYTILKNMR